MSIESISLRRLRRDGGTQLRQTMDINATREYSEAMERGEQFPPAVVFSDGESMWLADGFHRYDAHVLLNVELMECEVREGTRQDAILWAAKANEKHGVRRTPADREKTVVTLVNEFPEATQAQIARMADMPDSTVGSMLNRLGYRLGNSSGGPKRKEPEPIPSRSPIASALAGLPQQQREVFAPLLESAGVPEELALEAAANLAGMDLEKRAHVCELAASPKASDRSAAVAALSGVGSSARRY